MAEFIAGADIRRIFVRTWPTQRDPIPDLRFSSYVTCARCRQNLKQDAFGRPIEILTPIAGIYVPAEKDGEPLPCEFCGRASAA